jgi:pimeloyl-ACP methyl ester carboxylesterase
MDTRRNTRLSQNDTSSGLAIRGMTSHYLVRGAKDGQQQGRLRYLRGGTGTPIVLLHTVRTQAEHFHRLIPLLQDSFTVYALDLPGMGHSDIVPGSSYDEPAMRAAVVDLLLGLDLTDVTLVGESMGAVLALTAAADLPDRIRRVVAINPYDYAGGIKRSSLLARIVFSGVLAPVIGPRFAAVEPRPVMRAILRGGLGDKAALQDDYLDELLAVGDRPGYPAVARAVYGNLDSLVAARHRYTEVVAPIHVVYGEHDWSRRSDRAANSRLLPGAELTEVAGAGHFVCLERPDAVADILLRRG